MGLKLQNEMYKKLLLSKKKYQRQKFWKKMNTSKKVTLRNKHKVPKG